ncbi:MAG TPA: B12-binding domain-containing radical SAM protein [Acidobacteria bacterium]|nr:B12-binding domain-containing radical SAM protein [Acidobacteriota bacterium]
MARILFIQRTREDWLGPMYLSATLKEGGHRCDILVEPLERDGMVRRATEYRPDILAVSCLTTELHWAVRTAAEIRRATGALVVFGGTHPTLAPESCIAAEPVDVVCRGEGEGPLLELANALDGGGEIERIPNLWVKRGAEVVRNPLRPLVRDLDELPLPDRDLYEKYELFRHRGKKCLALGRGCPFSCAHCHNSAKMTVFGGTGPYVRWRHEGRVLDEIERLAARGNLKVLHFIDDSFGARGSWLARLVERMARMPLGDVALQANMRADLVSEELADAFATFGPSRLRLRIAVETGDEAYRTRILKKKLSDAELLTAAERLHRRGIGFVTYNMLGLPGERYEQALETLRFNLRLKPEMALAFIFQPLPGTELAELAVEKGFLDPRLLERIGTDEFPASFQGESPLVQPEIRKVENLQRVFGFVVEHPALFPVAARMCRLEWLAPALRAFFRLHLRWILRRRRVRDEF